jgi:uncharacterized protein (DUF1778 family)
VPDTKLLAYGNLPYNIRVVNSSKIPNFVDMAPVTRPKSMARLEARVSQETKALLQKAADLEGRTLTDFVSASAQAEAKRVIEQYQILKLSVEESEAFAYALLNPAKPNDALQAAALRYKQVISV